MLCGFIGLIPDYVNVDIDYARWLNWLFTPIVVAFVLPAIILVFLYLSCFFLYIYKWHRYVYRVIIITNVV